MTIKLIIFFILIAICFCIVQSGILRAAASIHVTPNLIIILIVYLALFHAGSSIPYSFSFCMGLYTDIYSSSLGYNALIYIIMAYLLGLSSNYIYKANPLSQGAALFIVSSLHNFVIYFPSFGKSAILESLYTTILGIIIFSLFRRIDKIE
jgi:rod shape-determining protein MreD